MPQDPRCYAVAERAVVVNPEGQWQLQAQVLHWRGETWRGGQLAEDVFNTAVAALRACQRTNPAASPSLTIDEPDRMAAVVSGPVILHQYLVANPANSTITELALWSTAPPLTALAGDRRRRGARRARRAAVHGLYRVVPVVRRYSCTPHHCRTTVDVGGASVARVVVNVMPKAEILDPQGQAIVGALGRLGHAGISDVRQGKRFELEVDDSVSDDQLAEIAESLLANTVIEDWSVTREPS